MLISSSPPPSPIKYLGWPPLHRRHNYEQSQQTKSSIEHERCKNQHYPLGSVNLVRKYKIKTGHFKAALFSCIFYIAKGSNQDSERIFSYKSARKAFWAQTCLPKAFPAYVSSKLYKVFATTVNVSVKLVHCWCQATCPPIHTHTHTQTHTHTSGQCLLKNSFLADVFSEETNIDTCSLHEMHPAYG